MIISGGYAIQFASMIIIDLRKRSLGDKDLIAKEDGVKIGVSIKKNHCFPNKFPYVKTEYYALFGQGIEQYLATIQLACDEGVLIKAGSYIRDVDDKGEVKTNANGEKMQWQGTNKLREYLIDNPCYLEELRSRLSGSTVTTMSDDEIEEIKQEEKELVEMADEEVMEALKGE